MADELRRNIPAPEQLAADPVPATHRALDFWRMLDELETDARLMRDFALVRGTDGAIKLKVPFAFNSAHKMRCDLLRLALQQAEAAYGLDRATRFFQADLDAVGKESIDCQRRILARLNQLQSEGELRGF